MVLKDEILKSLKLLDVKNTNPFELLEDSLLFKGSKLKLNKDNFRLIKNLNDDSLKKEVIFIDGGQAELLVSSNFVLAFVRICALTILGEKRTSIDTREFYVLVKSNPRVDEFGAKVGIDYHAEIFDVKGNIDNLVAKKYLKVDSDDEKLKSGISKGSITKVVNIVRRFAELSLAKEKANLNQDAFVILDGSLDAKYPNEEEIISSLGENVSALAKSNNLFMASGKTLAVVLSRLACEFLGLEEARLNGTGLNETKTLEYNWVYSFDEKLHFVKLHPKSRHVFRFDGNIACLPYLLEVSSDAIFIGYPYGLILVDKLARVSEKEKENLAAKFLLSKDFEFLKEHLASQDAHSILDKIA